MFGLKKKQDRPYFNFWPKSYPEKYGTDLIETCVKPTDDGIQFEHRLYSGSGVIPASNADLLRNMKVRDIFVRSFEPCRYCLSYDETVRPINDMGLVGRYHPLCHAKVLQLAREELAMRMKFDPRSAVIAFMDDPTPGDSITVGKMEAVFKKK